MYRIIRFLMVCELILTLSFAKADKNETEAARHLQQGEEHYRVEHYDQALKEFKRATELDPGLVKAWENMGWTYWKLGKVSKTIHVWENLKLIAPDEPRVYNMLGRVYTSKGDFDKARAAYEKSLKLQPDQTDARFYRAKLLGWQKQYAEAMRDLKVLLEKDPDNEKIRYYVAKFLFEMDAYEESLPHWEALVKVSPSEPRYLLGLAKTLYQTENYERSIQLYTQILEIDPNHVRALEAMANDALYTGQNDKAWTLYKKISKIDPKNVRTINQLTKIAFKKNDFPKAAWAAEQSLKRDPKQLDIRLLYADALRLSGNLNKAYKIYQEIMNANPNHFPAMVGLKELYVTQERYDKALHQLDLLLKMDPSNLYFMLDRAEILSYQGKFDQSISLLNEIRDRIAQHPGVFVLIYHGLTPRKRSDILKLSTFSDHLDVLKKLGYEPITPSDLTRAWEGKGTLPPKAVLVTFDDARKDSFQFADPVLKEKGFQAVMCVPISIINQNNPFFCTWDEIKTYGHNGRWSIQGHGGFSHEMIVVNEQGDQEYFLTNKLWLADQKRLETDEEFRQRIQKDYQYAAEELTKRVGTPVETFAYPEGNLGQERRTNHPGAFAENLKAIAPYFKTAFIQSHNGFNLAGDYPYMLKRLEPPAEMTAADLEQHLLLGNPDTRSKLILADILRWSGKLKEALALYEELEKELPQNERILLGKADVYFQYSNFNEARTYSQEVLKINPNNEGAAHIIQNLDRHNRPVLTSGFEYFKDKNDRKLLKWTESFDYMLKDRFLIQPTFGLASLEEKGVQDIDERQFTLAGIYRDELRTFKAGYTYRDFSKTAEDAYNYRLEASSPLLGLDRVSIIHGYESIETAKAALANIQYFRNSLGVDKSLPWKLSINGKFNYDFYNDDNERKTVRLGLNRLMVQKPKIWLGYEFVFDDADFTSPNYYAPQQLLIHQARVRAQGTIFKRFNYDLSYAGGIASEEDVDNRWVNSGEASLAYDITNSIDIYFQYAISKTPTYDSQDIQAGLKVRF